MFPYKSILPQTQPEKAAVQVSFVHEARLNRNDYRTKKVQYSEKLVLRQKKKQFLLQGPILISSQLSPRSDQVLSNRRHGGICGRSGSVNESGWSEFFSQAAITTLN